MSAPAKKRSIQPRESNGNASEDDNVDQMMINVEFEGRNPESSDFHGVKQLLQQLFLKAQLNVSDLASVLVNQQSIGSVIKQVFDDEDDDDDDDVDVNQVFGITTVLNISNQSECVEQLQKLMLNLSKQHGEPKVVEFINDLLVVNKKSLALLVNERYVNIPPAISVPLLESVSKELTNIKNKNSTNDFSYLVMICKLYKMKENKKNKTDQVIYSNAEEEIFDEESEFKFEFCVKNEKDSGLAGSWEEGDSEMIPYRRVLFFKSDKLDSIISKIQNMLS